MDTQLLRTRLIPILLAGVGLAALAQAPPRVRAGLRPYFPLATGNQWVYVERGRLAGEAITVEVAASGRLGGNTYYQLNGFSGAPAWVRYTLAGELVQYDPSGGPEKLWYAFSSPSGAGYRPQLPEPCLQQASIRTHNLEVRVPAGVFSSSLAIDYNPGPCADAGFSEEVFAPGVGLVRRTAITIAGPRTLELAYARIDGAAIAIPEAGFGLSIDRPAYSGGATLSARLSIRNSTPLPLALQFNSGQQHDLVVRDGAGRQVFLWSEGRAFIQALTRLELSPGERNIIVEVPLADRAGRAFPEGRYTVEAWLTTSGGKLYSATVPFDIQ